MIDSLDLIESAPIPIAILRGPEHVYHLANRPYRQLVNRDPLVGHRDAFPETGLLDEVMRTRRPLVVEEHRAKLDRKRNGTLEECFFRLHLEPLGDAEVWGVMVIAIDVTDERRARALAENTQARTAQLQGVTAALSRMLTAKEAASFVLAETVAAVGADTGGVALLTPDGEAVAELILSEDVPADAAATLRSQPLAAPLPVFDAARTGRVVWLGNEAEIAAHYPHLLPMRERIGAKAWIAVPLMFEGRSIGSLGYRFSI
jgi:hypothetical protein